MEKIAVIIYTLLGIIFLRWYFNRLKDKAEISCSTLRLLLNVQRWKIGILLGYPESLYLIGKFKGYRVRCLYTPSVIGTIVTLRSVPKIIPKKIPLTKFLEEYPKVYKNYVFNGREVMIQENLLDHGGKLSTEECMNLLQDLVHSCEVVESGNYTTEK